MGPPAWRAPRPHSPPAGCGQPIDDNDIESQAINANTFGSTAEKQGQKSEWRQRCSCTTVPHCRGRRTACFFARGQRSGKQPPKTRDKKPEKPAWERHRWDGKGQTSHGLSKTESSMETRLQNLSPVLRPVVGVHLASQRPRLLREQLSLLVRDLALHPPRILGMRG